MNLVLLLNTNKKWTTIASKTALHITCILLYLKGKLQPRWKGNIGRITLKCIQDPSKFQSS